MAITVQELMDALDGLPGDAEVDIIVKGHGSSHLVEIAYGSGYADLGDEGEFEDSLIGQHFYIISGGQRRNSPYLSEEEMNELDYLLD